MVLLARLGGIGGSENFHWVPLASYATAVTGGDTQATAQFVLDGSPTAGDYVELAWLDQHANYLVTAADTLETIVAGLAGFVNGVAGGGVTAAADGTTIALTYTGAMGANGNRVGIYGGVSGAGTEAWSPAWQMFSGGASPATWQVNLDFSNLTDSTGAKVTTTNVRKMRWTWAADWQFQNFGRSEFSIDVSNWQVSGSNAELQRGWAGELAGRRRGSGIRDRGAGIGRRVCRSLDPGDGELLRRDDSAFDSAGECGDHLLHRAGLALVVPGDEIYE